MKPLLISEVACRRDIFSSLAIVLDKPQLAMNIGMVARAMANFGLSDLRIVLPEGSWQKEGGLYKGAFATACGAVHIIRQARLCQSLEEAIEDIRFLWATTARPREQHKVVLSPELAMQRAAHRIAEETDYKEAVLFGSERAGLDNSSIALADAVVSFPIDPLFPSLNLAQAVLVVAYDYRRAVFMQDAQYPSASGEYGAIPADQAVFVVESQRPKRGALLAFFNLLESELDKTGFFRPPEKQKIMIRNLRNIFHRMALTEQDLRTLHGVAIRFIRGRRIKGSQHHKTLP